MALLHRRHSYPAACKLAEESKSFRTIFIDEDLHWKVLAQYTVSRDSRLSLVDLISFAVMKREGIRQALAFDRHFEQAGFSLYPD